MKLQRLPINLGSEYVGKWYFIIEDDNETLLEEAENRLRKMESGAVRGDGHVETWEDYCDGCPCYNDGFGSGFWVPIDMVDDFKKSWKAAKKVK